MMKETACQLPAKYWNFLNKYTYIKVYVITQKCLDYSMSVTDAIQIIRLKDKLGRNNRGRQQNVSTATNLT